LRHGKEEGRKEEESDEEGRQEESQEEGEQEEGSVESSLSAGRPDGSAGAFLAQSAFKQPALYGSRAVARVAEADGKNPLVTSATAYRAGRCVLRDGWGLRRVLQSAAMRRSGVLSAGYTLQPDMMVRKRSSGPRLGLVCLSFGREVRYRTITRTRYLALAPSQRRRKLLELYSDNTRRLYGALEFCAARDIHLYRVTSDLFPMDFALSERVLDELAPELHGFAARAEMLDVRVVAHPDQFVVLNSISRRVARQSAAILSRHARVFDRLGLPRSPWAALILHGGKSGRGEALLAAIDALPEAARSRLVLENDESAYGAAEILAICRKAGVPMVFDAHHHLVHEGLRNYADPSYADFVAAARETWPRQEWQIVHLSNGAGGVRDPRHSEYIRRVPPAYRKVPWIEVEARGKELAIARLRRRWPEAR
jgi:UV DNA damage endonuclease